MRLTDQQIDNMWLQHLRAKALAALKQGAFDNLQGLQGFELGLDQVLCSPLGAVAEKPLTARQFEAEITDLFMLGALELESESQQLGELGKRRRRRKKCKGNFLKKIACKAKKVHEKYNPQQALKDTRKTAKKIHKRYNPKAVLQKTHRAAKKVAKKISHDVTKWYQKNKKSIKKAAMIVAAAVAIYFTAGAAAPVIAKYYMQSQQMKMSKDAEKAMMRQAREEQARMESDPEYAAWARQQLEQDPQAMQAINQAGQLERREKTKKFMGVALPVAAVGALAFLS